MKKPWFYPVLTAGLLALLLGLGWSAAQGLGRPMTSDAEYYLDIAKHLASGQGYRLTASFWPEQPTMSRSPAWPFTVSLLLRVLPATVAPDLAMRMLAILLNAGVAALVAVLAWRLFPGPRAAWVAGLGYAIYPQAWYLADTGASEIVFLFLTLAGAQGILTGRWWSAGGFLCLGLAALSRANFVLWIAVAAPLGLLLYTRDLVGPAWRDRVLITVFAVSLFAAPTLFWALRNYRVSGAFPVLSTLRGQTFYGGNNAVVADQVEWWGYWIFPNSIPGETPMAELARQGLSELDVDRHYYQRGMDYLRENRAAMPRLWLGKLVRAYVPLPWKVSLPAYAIGVFRLVLGLAFLCGLCRGWYLIDVRYRIVLIAMVLTNAVTVVMFWGCARFAFALEPFLMPIAAGRLIGHLRCHCGET